MDERLFDKTAGRRFWAPGSGAAATDARRSEELCSEDENAPKRIFTISPCLLGPFAGFYWPSGTEVCVGCATLIWVSPFAVDQAKVVLP